MSAATVAEPCRCGRRLVYRPGEMSPTCPQCRNLPNYCGCEALIGTKETKDTNKAPEVPVASALVYAGILGEIARTAEPSTEADPVGIHVSLPAGAGRAHGPGPHVRIGNLRHPLLIWPLLMGRTGAGRKGEATSIAEVFLCGPARHSREMAVAGCRQARA